ncbi:LysR family transcriptional regulator [Pseudorhodobacter sp. W20_MBD10_FR17]|uniref:LysR family transcriptional regulator n=1 Tax=Pseudorhodobacter sp. W20_MBD10_FR17 TaxID=3240266 RepID=UPI003F96B9DC
MLVLTLRQGFQGRRLKGTAIELASAISHRINALETALGKRLFERRVREIQLTQDGIELARGVARIWEDLQQVAAQVTRQDVLRVSIGPYLSRQWLLPQKSAFEAENPGLRVDLIHRIGEPRAKTGRCVDRQVETHGFRDEGCETFRQQIHPGRCTQSALERRFLHRDRPTNSLPRPLRMAALVEGSGRANRLC